MRKARAQLRVFHAAIGLRRQLGCPCDGLDAQAKLYSRLEEHMGRMRCVYLPVGDAIHRPPPFQRASINSLEFNNNSSIIDRSGSMKTSPRREWRIFRC